MRLRSAIPFAAILMLSLGSCAEDGYSITDTSNVLAVSPLYLGMVPPTAPVQFEATIGGNAVPVTWESSDPAIATVSATGLVTAVDYGFTAITATLVSDVSRRKSASLTVSPPGLGMTSGVARTGIAGNVGDYLLYHILVEPGATNLTFTMSGGTGDLDMHTSYGAPPLIYQPDPADNTWICRPYASGNAETCPHASPAAGYWFALLDVYTDATGVQLVATITAP